MLSQNKIFLFIPLLMLAISCTKVNNDTPPQDPGCGLPQPDSTTCSYWQPAIGISAISGPATATAGQQVQLTVAATGRDGCASMATVTSLAMGNDITLTGDIFYHGCICTAALEEVNTTYTFTPSQAGTYTFHAETYEGTPIVHTLVVQ